MAGNAPSNGRVIDTLPGSLPIADLPSNVDAHAVASSFVPRLRSLSASDFTENALWRDTYALTGTTRTFFSSSAIESAWRDVCGVHSPTDFSLMPDTCHVASVGSQSSWIEARFTFKTRGSPALSCSGFVSLVPDAEGGWRIWLLRTVLERLEGLPDVDALQPQSPHPQGGEGNHQERDEFDCVVVGGGPAGMCVAGHLQALGISYVVIDRNSHVGDSWMTRYDSVKRQSISPCSCYCFHSNTQTVLTCSPIMLLNSAHRKELGYVFSHHITSMIADSACGCQSKPPI